MCTPYGYLWLELCLSAQRSGRSFRQSGYQKWVQSTRFREGTSDPRMRSVESFIFSIFSYLAPFPLDLCTRGYRQALAPTGPGARLLQLRRFIIQG
jgi:hypothetical protein